MHHGGKSAVSTEQLLAQLQGKQTPERTSKSSPRQPSASPSLSQARRQRQQAISSAGALRKADELLNLNKEDRDEVDRMLLHQSETPPRPANTRLPKGPRVGSGNSSTYQSPRKTLAHAVDAVPLAPVTPGSTEVNREPTLYDLRRMLRRFDSNLVARESLLQLMEQEETVACPLTLVQQQYSQLMQEAIGTDVSTLETQQREKEDEAILRGVGVVMNPDAKKKAAETPGERFSATATAQLERLDLHETYVDLAHEGLRKDQKILRLQRRITELEDHAAKAQRSLIIGGSGALDSASPSGSGKMSGTTSTAANLTGYHARVDDRDRTTILELMDLNKALSEHVDVLEFNTNQGFCYSDVGMQKTLHELTCERDDLMLQNMQLAECFVMSEQEKQKLSKSNEKLLIVHQDSQRQVETLEKELSTVRTEMGRVKRLYQERAMSAL